MEFASVCVPVIDQWTELEGMLMNKHGFFKSGIYTNLNFNHFCYNCYLIYWRHLIGRVKSNTFFLKKKIEKRYSIYYIPDFVENVTTALVYENGLVPALCREKVQFTGVNFSITYSHWKEPWPSHYHGKSLCFNTNGHWLTTAPAYVHEQPQVDGSRQEDGESQ